MDIDTAFLVITVITLIINYLTMFIAFPHRFGKIATICVPIIFSVVVHIILYLTGTQSTFYRFYGGFAHAPLFIILSKGYFLQRVFVIFFVMVCTGFQLALASAISGIFTQAESNEFWLTVFILTMFMYTVYTLFILRFARSLFARIFISSGKKIWLLFSFMAAFTYAAMVVVISVSDGVQRISLLVFAFCTFCALCYAIINTHEKTKRRLEAEFANSIISSGRGHYEKMNEMQDALRIMRHDAKYQISVAREMLRSGKKEELEEYLTETESLVTENELPVFCDNPVVNALLSGYAERCRKSDIRYGFTIALPENMVIPNYEMCVVFGNLLENAVEAALKLDSGRYIELKANYKHQQFAVTIKNSFNGTVLSDDGQPVSGKKDGGFGLRSVHAVTERYGGKLIAEWDEDTFTAYVMMDV